MADEEEANFPDEPESPAPEVDGEFDPQEISKQSSEQANATYEHYFKDIANQPKKADDVHQQIAAIQQKLVEISQPNDAKDQELSALRNLVEETAKRAHDLEEQLARMKTDVSRIPKGFDPFDPNFPIIFAKAGATDKQWQQQAIHSNAFVSMPGGLNCTSDTIPSALFDDDPDVFALMRIPDNESGTIVMKWAKIGMNGRDGTSAGVVTVDSVSGSAGVDGVSSGAIVYDVYNYGDTPGMDSPIYSGLSLTGNGNGWRKYHLELEAGSVGQIVTYDDGMGGTAADLVWVDEGPVNEDDCVS